MKKNYSIEKKPVSPQDEFVLQLFSEYNDGSPDIMFINKTKNLLFLSDYMYTLNCLKANNSPSARFKRIEEEFIKSL